MSCFIPCHVPLTAIPVLTIPAPVPRHRRPQTPSLKCAAHNADGRPSAYDPGKRVDHSHVSAAVQAAATAAFSAATGHESKAQSSETLTAQLSSGTATASSTTAGTAPAADSVSAVKDKQQQHAQQQQQRQQQPNLHDQHGEQDQYAEPAHLDELLGRLEERLALQEDTGKQLQQQLKREPVLSSFDLAGVAELICSGKAKHIVVMCGAGISVSAGIPDFRTPGTGLYSQLERFGLPEPEAVFSIKFFKNNPKPFHMLARELFPGNYGPTPTHYFMKLLHNKGLLLRCFTQNIDSLECLAGLPKAAVVAAHGNFDSAHCIKCDHEHSLDHVKQAVFSDEICYCTKCGGLVKPDIVFFGEQLPDRFYEQMDQDFPACDLLLVMGTSLVVQPFASLIDAVPEHCPRVLINRERVGEGTGTMGILSRMLGLGGSGGFVFEGDEGCYRDVLYLGDSDDGVRDLAQLLGWDKDLEDLIADNSRAEKSDSKL